MKENENNSNNRTWLFLAGAVLGGAAVYYLNTPKGKKWRDSVVKSTGEISETVKTKFNDTVETASEAKDNFIEKATDVKKNLLSGLQDKTYDKLDSFEKGITKAKEKLRNGSVDVKNTKAKTTKA